MRLLRIDGKIDCYKVFDRIGEGVHMQFSIALDNSSGTIQAQWLSCGFSPEDQQYLDHIKESVLQWIEHTKAALIDQLADELEYWTNDPGLKKWDAIKSAFGCTDDDLFEALAAIA